MAIGKRLERGNHYFFGFNHLPPDRGTVTGRSTFTKFNYCFSLMFCIMIIVRGRGNYY